MTLEIERLLIISTAHVTEETATALNEADCKAWPVVGGPHGEYGWFMSATAQGRDHIPDDLKAVLTFARDAGARYVLLDRDAEQVAGLPAYEW